MHPEKSDTATLPEIAVVVVSFNTRDILRACLQSLVQDSAGLRAEVVVVDNASNDDSAAMVAREFPQFRLVRSKVNLGFAAANNVGFRELSAPFIVLLNPDAVLAAGTLTAALKRMRSNPSAGLAGGRLNDRHGRLQPSGRLFPSLLNELLVISGLAARYPHSRFFGRFDRTWADPAQPAQVDWVPGAFTIIRRTALEKCGWFDERFFLYYEEVDLCRRIAGAGFQIWYWPEIVVMHLGGESAKTLTTENFSSAGSQLTLWRMRSGLLYYRKHHGVIGAWLAARLEIGWLQLRLLVGGLRSGHERLARRKRLTGEVCLMRQAWFDTAGGSVCPERPW